MRGISDKGEIEVDVVVNLLPGENRIEDMQSLIYILLAEINIHGLPMLTRSFISILTKFTDNDAHCVSPPLPPQTPPPFHFLLVNFTQSTRRQCMKQGRGYGP